ncbi:MAG: hypothetical protein LBL80_05345 [Ruminococcus sp.]|jgi:hypothetical protein|nr:hypothetical protein [Ruminococcus sp.]
MEKRQLQTDKKAGLTLSDLMLTAVLLAAGAVLKFAVGNIINFGMKPNFIIAMYCIIILLIRPKISGAAIIGILAGAVCQFFPGTPYVNLVSELIGAVVMCLLIGLPFNFKNKFLDGFLKVPVNVFITTLFSGFSFLGLMWLLYFARGAKDTPPAALGVFLGIILGTATINAVIVSVLYPTLKKVLKK